VGSRDESGPPDTYPRLTGQPAPDKKQPRSALTPDYAALRVGRATLAAEKYSMNPVPAAAGRPCGCAVSGQ